MKNDENFVLGDYLLKLKEEKKHNLAKIFENTEKHYFEFYDDVWIDGFGTLMKIMRMSLAQNYRAEIYADLFYNLLSKMVITSMIDKNENGNIIHYPIKIDFD